MTKNKAVSKPRFSQPQKVEFENLFENQSEFQKIVGNLPNLHDVAFIKDQTLSLIAEITEALNEIPWKSWKKNQTLDADKFNEELADCQLFLINIIISSGQTPQEFMELCLKKQNINVQRQMKGY